MIPPCVSLSPSHPFQLEPDCLAVAHRIRYNGQVQRYYLCAIASCFYIVGEKLKADHFSATVHKNIPKFGHLRKLLEGRVEFGEFHIVKLSSRDEPLRDGHNVGQPHPGAYEPSFSVIDLKQVPEENVASRLYSRVLVNKAA